jgi:HAD superfamily hydrolase (TIGR01484 family)
MEQDTLEGRRYSFISGVKPKLVGDLLRVLDRPPIKLLAIAEEPLLDQLSAELRPKYAGRVHISKSKPFFLEFSHPEATKGHALAALAEFYGIKREEVIAIGDSFNDLEMIEYAGLGVMVANAREELKSLADYVTKANNGAGVVEVIEKFVLGR